MEKLPIELQLFIYGIGVSVVGWFFKTILKVVTDIRNEVKKMNENFIVQESKLVAHDMKFADHDKKLDDHETRIRIVEKTAS